MLSDWKSDEYLKKMAGHVNVRVEKRRNASERYGNGTYERMTFGEFVDKKGSGTLYLNTQSGVYEGDDDREDESYSPTDLLTGVCAALRDDFPLVPKLCGHLIPSDYNVWFGSAPSAAKDAVSSSGLHHDYHDNLYVLIRGRKKFHIFDPSQSSYMYTHGEIAHVHRNGRICYEGALTREDGVDVAIAARYDAERRSEDATDALEHAEEALQSAIDANCDDEETLRTLRDDVERAERDVEDALEQMLDCAGDEEDDFDDDGDDVNENVVVDDDDRRKKRMRTATSDTNLPPHFCQVSMLMSSKERQTRWPQFANHATSATVDLEAGEMLWLPAGFFHEVHSTSSSRESADSSHLAFNYWFHPPSSSGSFERPYISPYLREHWMAG